VIYTKELIQRIGKCNLCNNVKFENLVNSRSKPYLEFKVYENWVPDGDIKCLFIGESPPGRDIFFYDSGCEGPFRRNLLNILQINKSGYEGLCDFKNRGFLLVDVLKCRINKRGGNIPKFVIDNCLEIFKFEIELLSTIKNVKKFVVLGKTALTALRMLGFNELNGYSVTKDCGKMVKSHGFQIFVCTLPFARTKKYWNTVQVKERLRAFIELGSCKNN
jgi:uracil-DNA glycosylase